jgi:hypothetical protein
MTTSKSTMALTELAEKGADVDLVRASLDRYPMKRSPRVR